MRSRVVERLVDGGGPVRAGMRSRQARWRVNRVVRGAGRVLVRVRRVLVRVGRLGGVGGWWGWVGW
ncbi:hypothetical protein GCM10009804_73840 [Kribbella hippodromi]|uniref:Uncharacterized protein n=1 Tax=Kribbella hippodromi TaxID=434347 RepID=A0ABN2EGT7_9ACTN